MQGVFLRTDLIREELGVDLRDDRERRAFLGDFLERLFCAEGGAAADR
jgi:hypothetical protein